MSTEKTTQDLCSGHTASPVIGSSDVGDSDLRGRMNEFGNAVELLGELCHAGLDDVGEGLHQTIERLGKLADSVEGSLSDFNDDDPDVLDLVNFVIESCGLVRQATLDEHSGGMDPERLGLLREEVEFRLESCDSLGGFDSDPLDDFDNDSRKESDVVAPTSEEVAALLSGLHGSTGRETDAAVSETERSSMPAKPEAPSCGPADVNPTRADAPTVGDSNISLPCVDEIEIDEELREAFMDDATRGLASMEQALLDLESNPGDEGPVATIGRELHTIKGASASIGMSHLATYIHEVEELIRETQNAERDVTTELLLPHVDVVRARVDGEDIPEGGRQAAATAVGNPSSAFRPNAATATGAGASPQLTVQPSLPVRARIRSTDAGTDGHGDDETVRVKASQLNRLMDMLSELVMLRNQRDTEISELKGIHDELVYSVTRVRMLSHEGEAVLARERFAEAEHAQDSVSFSQLNEVANDVLESAQRLRECYRPVADGNQAVSQFIRNFRLELVQLRRMPVSGLFRRLHRAISDAARSEQKQIRVELVGENTGIERSLQERIFEPLLHIVRNSVSHGIESPQERTGAGKPPQGVIKLHAHSGPDLLVIEVSDDGRGLDYDAIRRRGIERGLIESDKSISRAELARLIFHSGFSTRETANQISGRGVGMDIVATTLERMRGWVEVESENGSGSTIRLSLPLPSMIQHAMVFRSGGQLFALPAQSVRRTGEFDSASAPVDLNQILSLSGSAPVAGKNHSRRSIIELATGSATAERDSERDFTLLVDHVLGPEEVVVRPMPTMLKSHPLCIGATLSGMGEVVLLLDPRALAEAGEGYAQVIRSSQTEQRGQPKEQPKVLVVDDSKSARIRIARALAKYPVTVIQVDDGQDAIELMTKESFATVFSDIDMPRMSGLELLETIKSEPRLENIPVIMISSRSVETTRKHVREMGALDYIQKPLTTERLDEAIAELDWAKH